MPLLFQPKYSLLTLLLAAALTACGSGAATTTNPPLPTATVIVVQPTAPASATIAVPPAEPTASVATPLPTNAATNGASVPIAITESQAIAQAVLAYWNQSQSQLPAVVGATALEGDYATALVQPYGTQGVTAFLRRSTNGWQVIQATASMDRTLLQQNGVPANLPAPSDANEIMAAWSAQLQDARGTGVTGSLILEGIAGDYARGSFQPADPTTQDGFTAFFVRSAEGWKQVTGGTAFDTATLQQLGIPTALWNQS